MRGAPGGGVVRLVSSGGRWALLVLPSALLLLASRSTRAQRAPAAGVVPAAAEEPPFATSGTAHGAFRGTVGAARPAPWWAPLASAVVPGAGQAVLGDDRFVAYVAVEGYAWLQYARDHQQGVRDRRAYRDLANAVARRFFTSVYPDGDWKYYETMEHFAESGVYDVTPGDAQLEPDPDTTTFNGHIWLLARHTYWQNADSAPAIGSPAYQHALDFYRQRAITSEYRWSWRNAQLEQDLFRRTISRSNNAFRQSIQDLGVILANHALSTVDAFLVVRLRQTRVAGDDRMSVNASIPWAPLGRPRDPDGAGKR